MDKHQTSQKANMRSNIFDFRVTYPFKHIQFKMRLLHNQHFSSLWIIFYFTLSKSVLMSSNGGADLHSTKLFCSGVPVRTTLLRVLIAFIALEMPDASLRRMCPSSHTTKSGPENQSTGEILFRRQNIGTKSILMTSCH